MRTIDEVVQSGSCSGCGGCSVASEGTIKMVLQSNRVYLPVTIQENVPQSAGEACPFTSVPSRATRQKIGKTKAGAIASSDPLIGYHSMLGVGRISGPDVWGSSSGGLTTWLLSELLNTGQIDGVIHLGSSGDRKTTDEMFAYQISRNLEEIHAGRGTKYYASTISEVFGQLGSISGRFAFVGVPCFVNSVDFLRQANQEISQKIAFTIGLVCGHLKSQVYAQALSWQLGLSPAEVETVNFRQKNKVGNPLDYIFEAWDHAGTVRSQVSSKLLSSNWGHSAFSLSACNSCTDLFGYSSDVTFGDAWLPEYANEPRGTNIVVSRSKIVNELFSKGASSGVIEFAHVPASKIIDSQKGGIQHRVDGFLIRNQNSDALDPQMDFSHTVAKPTIRRRVLIFFRRYIQESTIKPPEMTSRKRYILWKVRFTVLRYIYKLLDIISKLG